MQLLRVRNGKLSSPLVQPLAATLGSFDGLHLGHQEIIRGVVAAAKARLLVPALITFIPHPSVALGKIEKLPRVTTLRQRLSLLESLGIEKLIVISFTKHLGSLTWQQFCDEYLRRILNVQHLIIGPDARIGRGAEGTAPLMKGYLEAHGCTVETRTFVLENNGGKKIASRMIREAVAEGEIAVARALLGRPFTLEGKVVHGDGRGKDLGFATANLFIRNQVVPKDGVYCGIAAVDGIRIKAVCNIGVRPTFNGSKRQVEVHLLEKAPGDIYGKLVAFSITARLRDEMKFSSPQELQKQIAADISQATELLKGEK